MKTRIHVNQHKIRSNAKNSTLEPVLTCKTYKSNDYGNEVAILDDNGLEVGRFIYRPNKPLACGAKVWFETDKGIKIIS